MPTEERVLRLESCTVDLQRGMVFRDAVRVPLTQRELALVAYFAARPGKLVARDTLLS